MPLPSDRKPITPEKALLRLEERCVRSEMCAHEALGRMARWGLSLSDSMKVLDSLTSRKFIDNARFAGAFVRDKYRFQRWGRRKIAYALAMKKIPRALIDKAMEQIDEKEYRTILSALIAARANVLGEEARTYQGRTKLFRMAASRGYESDLIAAELAHLV